MTEELTKIITNPGIVDESFADFLSESDFILDVERLLASITAQMEKGERMSNEVMPFLDLDTLDGSEQPLKVISFIAIDIDDQGNLANTYGDQVMRDLNREVGLRILGQLHTAFKQPTVDRLYHIYAGRYYLLLKDTSLEQARMRAEQLREALRGSYRLAHHTSVEKPTLPDDTLPLTITVRLGVTSYTYAKLEDILPRYPTPDEAIIRVATLITQALDETLSIGHREGGNVVMSWDPSTRGMTRWS